MPRKKKNKLVTFYYFNDEKEEIGVWHNGGLMGMPTMVSPATGAFFTLELADDEAIFIKKWPKQVMIDRCLIKNLEGINEED